VPREQALRLTQTASIGRHHAIASSIAALTDLAKEPHGGIAASIPALEEIRLIWVEDAVPAVAPPFAPHKGGAAEIALHRAQPQPNVLGNGRSRPALVVQGPDLRMQGLPAGLAVPRALLGGGGCLDG
jgi:hypothetical protein